MIKKIISGGQTGAHRAALDLAMELNITHGGWIPKGRLTEDGTLPEEYNLKEMPTDSYSASTEQNVMDSDGTLIISHGDLTGGSAYTCKMSKKHKKLWLHIDLDNVDGFQAGQILKSWIGMHEIQILNVAGSRASKDPVIYKAVQDILRAAITLEMITASVVKGSDLAPNLPRTVDEAVQRLLTELKLRDKAMIAKLDKEDDDGNRINDFYNGLAQYHVAQTGGNSQPDIKVSTGMVQQIFEQAAYPGRGIF